MESAAAAKTWEPRDSQLAIIVSVMVLVVTYYAVTLVLPYLRRSLQSASEKRKLIKKFNHLLMEPPSASSVAFPIVLREVREFLGPSCDAQLRRVSRLWRDQMATTPVEELRINDYLSISLISWAWEELNMPRTNLVTEKAAVGGHQEVLQWLRAQDPPCPWGKGTCYSAAKGGHVHVLEWLRAQDPPCPWEGTCTGAAVAGHVHVLEWLRAQDPPCPWLEETAREWGPYL